MANAKNKTEKEKGTMETAEQATPQTGQAVNKPINKADWVEVKIPNKDKYQVSSVEVSGDNAHVKGAIDCPIHEKDVHAHWRANVDLTLPLATLAREYIRQLVYALDGKILPDGPVPSVIDNATLESLSQRSSGGGASKLGAEFHARAKKLAKDNVTIPADFREHAGKDGTWTPSLVKRIYDSRKYPKFNAPIDELRKTLEKAESGKSDDLFG